MLLEFINNSLVKMYKLLSIYFPLQMHKWNDYSKTLLCHLSTVRFSRTNLLSLFQWENQW